MNAYKFTAIGIIVMSLSLKNLQADGLDFTFSFERPVIIEKDSGIIFSYHNCVNLGFPNTPLLPYQGVKILLPQGQEIDSIRIINYNYYEIIRGINVQLAPFPMHSLGSDNNCENDLLGLQQYVPNNDRTKQYQQNAIISGIQTDFLYGHSIGLFNICPVIYDQNSHNACLLSSLEIQVVTKLSARASRSQRFLQQSPDIVTRISNLVLNPELLHTYFLQQRNVEDEVDLLIITTPDFKETLSDFVDY